MKPIVLSLLVCILLGGCVSVSERQLTISGGETITVPIAKGGALPAENADIKIEMAGFGLDGAAKELTYGFGFSLKTPKGISSVKVEDVSDSQSETLVDDQNPKLEHSYWMGKARPKKIADSNLHWVFDDGDSVRIYRFTIAMSDGGKYVMYQASVYGRATKPMIRNVLQEG